MSGEIPVAVRQDVLERVEIDENVEKHFPTDYRSSSAVPHGSSFWTKTARVTVEDAGGGTKTFFLKTGRGDLSRSMMRSEYEGVQALYKVVPALVPRPFGWGTYQSDPETHFYLADYVPMKEELPDCQRFVEMIAKLHKDSMPLSPNGKFGFPITTYEGNMPQIVDWCDTWEESYSRNLRGFSEQERVAQGPSEELDRLLPQLFDKVIPRLLRPLQTHGRIIKPCLVHGDLWYKNIATNALNGEPIIFDPSVFWGHNEYDLGNFAIPRYGIGREFMRAYRLHIPDSAPEEDYEDRNRLYGIHGHFCASTLYTPLTKFREDAINDISYLVGKYPNGYQDVAPSGDT